MKRFILLSFAFLAWGFWELSGGADFVPETRERAQMAAANAPPAAASETTPEETASGAANLAAFDLEQQLSQALQEWTPQPATAEGTAALGNDPTATPSGQDLQTQTDLLVRSALSSEAFEAVRSADDPDVQLSGVLQPDPVLGISLDGLSSALTPEDASRVEGLRSAPAAVGALTGQSITLSSVDAAASDPAQASETPFVADRRTIAGDRANMRAGPGTEFDVLATLAEGEAVEVLNPAETSGWLRLRVLATGEIGYMADWLVTPAAN